MLVISIGSKYSHYLRLPLLFVYTKYRPHSVIYSPGPLQLHILISDIADHQCSMNAVKLLFIILLLLRSRSLFVSCQEGLVYRGTGVDYNGRHNSGIYNNQTIILGGLFSIHASEDNICTHIPPLFIQDVEAMALAVDTINNDTNILPGVTLAYEIRDTCILPNYALEQTLSFITEREPLKDAVSVGVSGVVGTSFSSVSVAVASLLRLFKIPQISHAATAEVLSDKSRFDYFFRTVPPDSLQARAIAAIIINFNWIYVVAIHSDDDYGRGGIKALRNELEAANFLCLALVIPVSYSATSKDYREIVDKIDQEWVANSSVVILFAHLNNAEGIFEAVYQRQAIDSEFAKRKITWIGTDSWGDGVSLRYNKIVHGSLSTIPKVHSYKVFDEYFLSLHPKKNNTRNPWFNEYWEDVFNCSLGGQNNLDRESCDLDNQVQSIESRNFQNYIMIDAVYAFAHALHRMQQDYCPHGEGLCREILESRGQFIQTVINGELLLQYLHNVSFNGTSADRIQFDENGDQQGGYDIVNLQVDSYGEYKYIEVGGWDIDEDSTAKLFFHREIQWINGMNGSDVPDSVCSQACGGGEYPQPIANQAECCWICKRCGGTNEVSDGIECRECKPGFRPSKDRTNCTYIQPTFLTWSDPLAIVIVILSLIGIAATTFVIAVFIVYRDTHLIKASSRELSSVLLCGIMLCYFMPFIFITKPSPASCAIRRFGVGFCFSICFSALLVKTNRIHRIFNRKSVTVQAPPLVSPQSQLFFTSLLVVAQVLIATVWLVVEHPSTIFLYSDFTTELHCSENPYIGLSVIIAYNLLLLVITTYYAVRTRKVPQNFNEAKFISLTVYSLCILWFAFIPTYFIIAALHTSFRSGSLVIAIILSATVTLCCLLVPKVYFLLSRKRKESDQIDTLFTSKNPITSNLSKEGQSYRCNLIDASIQTDVPVIE